MKRLMSLLAACAVAGAMLSGCSKGEKSASATVSGPITDEAQSGLKPQGPTTPSGSGDAAHGKTIFAANCASCHGAAGAGGGIGPSLKGEKKRKNLAAAIAWIKDPQPPMPKLFPATLSESDVADVAAYVESL